MRRIQLNIRLADEKEYKAMQKAAEKAGMSVSEWARVVLGAASGRYELLAQLRQAKDAAAAAAE
jgi:hypothetical protein